MNISKINFNRISFGKINVYGQKQEFENATNPFSSKTQVDRFEQSENSDKERKTREGRLKFSGKVDDDILKKLNTDFLANAADLNDDDINLAAGNIKALAQTNIGNPFEDDELLNHANCPEMLAVVLKKPKDFERFIQNVSSLNEVVVKHFGERAGFVQTLYQETFCELGKKSDEEFKSLASSIEGLSRIRIAPTGSREVGLLDNLGNKVLKKLISDTEGTENILNNAIKLNSVKVKSAPGALISQTLLGRLSGETPIDILSLSKNRIDLIVQNALVLSNVDLVSKQGERQNILEELSSKELLAMLSKDPEEIETIRKVFSEYPEVDFNDIDFSSLNMMMDFAPCIGKKSICELSRAQRKEMAQCAIKHRNALIGGVMKSTIGILPYDKETYNEFLASIKLSQGVDVNPLGEDETKEFEKGLFDLAQSVKTLDFENLKIDMKNSRKTFIRQVSEETKHLTPRGRGQVLDYFGFDINEEGELSGYPAIVQNKPIPEDMSENAKSAFVKIRKIVLEFNNNNPVTVSGNQNLEKALNKVLPYLNEFRTAIGKKQHSGHSYTLDVHSLKVLSEVAKNPEFEKLSSSDKKIMLLASLLHDITKRENKKDDNHPSESALDAYFICEKLGFNKEEQMKLYDIVKTHDWLEKVCMGDETFVEKAFELKRGNLFELARIFTQADLKSIDGKGSYFSQFSPQLDEKTQQMRAQIAIFKKTQPFLPVSKFPKASELKDANGVLTWDKNGVQNRVIDLNAISNFEQAGFEKGTTAENLKILIHAINMNAEQSLGSLDYLSSLDNGALISTSYLMDPTHDFQTFMSFGFVLNVDTGNIHAGKDEDFASGINKDIKNKILTREDFARGDYADRNYFPKLFKESMQLSDEEYADFIEKYSNMTLAQIEKQDPDVARKINEVLKNANNEKIKKGKSYNEILVTRPEIQAVFVRKNESNSMPLFLRKYAQEHDIPVVLLGN